MIQKVKLLETSASLLVTSVVIFPSFRLGVRTLGGPSGTEGVYVRRPWTQWPRSHVVAVEGSGATEETGAWQ